MMVAKRLVKLKDRLIEAEKILLILAKYIQEPVENESNELLKEFSENFISYFIKYTPLIISEIGDDKLIERMISDNPDLDKDRILKIRQEIKNMIEET